MKYIVKNKANPAYCGIDAGGVQFANGTAAITDKYLAEWFRTHDGYSVEAEKKSDKKSEDKTE